MGAVNLEVSDQTLELIHVHGHDGFGKAREDSLIGADAKRFAEKYGVSTEVVLDTAEDGSR